MRQLDPDDPERENLECVAGFRRARAAFDRGLVVLAMGHPCWVVRHADGTCELMVRPEHAPAVRQQLEIYEAEDRRFRLLTRHMKVGLLRAREQGTSPLKEDFRRAWGPISVMFAVLAGFFAAQLRYPEWLESVGANDAEAIFSRLEIWRCLTALCLHADIGHLAGNLGAIALYGFFLLQRMNAGAFLFLSLLTGTAGNFLTVALYHPEPHRAIGASTMAFAMLGLLLSEGVRDVFKSEPEIRHPGPVVRLGVPVIVGLIMLGWMGSAPGSDVIAHAAGLFAGFATGVTGVAAWKHSQSLTLLAAVGLTGAWGAAIIAG